MNESFSAYRSDVDTVTLPMYRERFDFLLIFALSVNILYLNERLTEITYRHMIHESIEN